MARITEAVLNAKGLKFAIVSSRFNSSVVARLESGTQDCLARHGAEEMAVSLVRVPGCFEIPQVVKKLAEGGKHDAVIALGALIRGETPHFDLIASGVVRGLQEVALQTGTPVSFGIVTADSTEQATERAGGKMGNRGWDAALAAIEMAQLGRELG
jgi:6,7-dimethyl-8-ribityllumazine synthase